MRSNSTRQTDRAHAHAHERTETKRFPGWTHPPTSDSGDLPWGVLSWKTLSENPLEKLCWKTLLENSRAKLSRKMILASSLGKLSWKSHLEISLGKLSWKALLENSLGELSWRMPWKLAGQVQIVGPTHAKHVLDRRGCLAPRWLREAKEQTYYENV